MVGELPPLSNFVRGAEATETDVDLTVEFADIRAGRFHCHGSNLRGFGLELGCGLDRFIGCRQ